MPLYAETGYVGKRVDSSDHGEVLSSLKSPSVANIHTLLPFELLWNGHWRTFSAFVDSGAAGSFMDSTLARNLKLPTFELPCQLAITAVDGQPLGMGRVERVTCPICIRIGNHMEEIKFFSY